MKQLKKLPNISGVGQNSTFTLSVPVGAKEIEKIGLDLAGTTKPKTAFTNLEVRIDGTPIQIYKEIAHLENLSAYYGLNVNTDEIVLPFQREFLQNAAQAGAFNLGLSDVTTFHVVGDIDGTVSTDIVVTGWDVETQKSKKGASAAEVAAMNRLGFFTRVKHFSHSLTGSGTTEIDNIPKQAFLQALHMIQSSDVITNVEVWANDSKVWDASASRMERVVERSGRTKQANTYHVDMMLDNELGDQFLLSGLADFRLKLEHSGAATVDMYVEYMDTWRAG